MNHSKRLLITVIALAPASACVDIDASMGTSEQAMMCQTDPCTPPPPEGGGGGGGGVPPTGVPTYVSETMEDACSADVVFQRNYSDTFTPDGIALKRNASGDSGWSPLMPVNGHVYVRWWCHSTDGNIFDPGAWRVNLNQVGINCSNWADGSVASCLPIFSVNVPNQDWTAERSRCSSDRTRAVRARLTHDPVWPDSRVNRRLFTECLE
jgi:hypothetical protein